MWTESQKTAINDRNHTLLVSAGAGAGKTSCLTERIARRLVANGEYDSDGTPLGYDISEILVVTYTKTAAADIKEKLYRNLSSRLAEDPENKNLFSQLMGIGSASISTIHSFCLGLIRDNFQKLNVSPACRVLDDIEGAMIRSKIQKKVIEDFYVEYGDEFREFAELFSSDHGGELEEMLLELYGKLRSLPDPFEWLDKVIEKSEGRENFDELFDSELGTRLKKASETYAKEILDIIDEARIVCDRNENKNTFLHFSDHLEAIERFLEATTYEEARAALKYSTRSLAKKGYPDDDAEYIVELQSKIKDDKLAKLCALYENSVEKIKEDLKKTTRMLRMVKKIETEFDKRYSDRKRELGGLDYSDLEYYTLSLLKNEDGTDSDICLSLKESLKEIYIDEYQDVNPLQDEIFRRIRKKNNCFMVGDVKQSIYRFRNAEPSIFMGYNDSFPTLEHATDEAKIYLSDNFRCSNNIINYVNTIFKKIYTKENGADGYGEKEALIFGKTEMSDSPVVTVCCETIEDEADFVAREILRKVNSGEFEFSDNALLLRSMKDNTKPFVDAFKLHGIPYYIEQSGDFLFCPEVLLVMSLLRMVDNPMDDISLCAALMSPVFDFSAETLYEIKQKSKSKELFRALQSCAYERERDKHYSVKSTMTQTRRKSIPIAPLREARVSYDLKKKCDETIRRITSWRDLVENVSTDDFIWYLYTTTPIYSGSENAERRNNLILLYEYARRFDGGAFKGLSAFVEYYNDVYDEKTRLGEADRDIGDGVKIMSIHKSKGLDFKNVFVARLGKKPNQMDMNKKYLLTRKNGLSFRLRDVENRKKHDTLVRRLDAFDEARALYVEEMRLLYVALTRAKKNLYVLGKPSIKNSMFHIITNAVEGCDCTINLTYEKSTDSVVTIKSKEESRRLLTLSELKERLGSSYKNTATIRKASVSELKMGELGYFESVVKDSIIMEKPSFATERKTGAMRGTAMHEFMQFCDFTSVEHGGALQEAKRLCSIGMLTDEQLELLNYKKLESFFKSELYSMIKSSRSVFREKRFSIRESASLLGKDPSESFLVQGVIDLFFENPDGTFTVVDYKTDFVAGDENVLVEHHRSQISYYSRAIEKMTEKKVSRAIIYSFSLEKSVELTV